MRTFRLTTALLGLLAATAALATPPDPPNMRYSGAFNRRLNFVWQSVPRVNWYELWQRPNDGAAWVKFATLPSGRVGVGSNVSTHLLNWEQVRYQLKGCNPSGCGSSAELDAFDNQAIPAMVYIKPSRTQPGARFGSAIDLSENGQTLVSVSRSETDTPTGRHAIVNIYLFTYPSAGGLWRQQTRLFPSVTQPNNGAGVVANLSGDGNVLVVGVPAERASAATTSPEIGAVYLFRRTGTTWQQERRFAPPPDMTPAHYGFAAEISEDGNTIMIGRETDGGTAEVYKYADGAWTLAATIPGPGGAMGCNRIRLSGDGRGGGTHLLDSAVRQGTARISRAFLRARARGQHLQHRRGAAARSRRRLPGRNVLVESGGIAAVHRLPPVGERRHHAQRLSCPVLELPRRQHRAVRFRWSRGAFARRPVFRGAGHPRHVRR